MRSSGHGSRKTKTVRAGRGPRERPWKSSGPRATTLPVFRTCSTRWGSTAAACTTPSATSTRCSCRRLITTSTGFAERWKAVLNAPGSPLGNVRIDARRSCDASPPTAISGAAWSPTARSSWHRAIPWSPTRSRVCFARSASQVRHTLDRAVEAGELGPEANTRAQTRFVIATIQGLIVLGKSAHTRKELKDVVDVAISALK